MTSSSYEQLHGPPATQPEQQNGRPTWKTALPTISTSQVTQVKGYSVLKRRIREPRGEAASRGRPMDVSIRSYRQDLKAPRNADEETVNAALSHLHVHVLFT